MARLLGYVTGLVNQELLLQVEYLAAENRILRGASANPGAAVERGSRHYGGIREKAWAESPGENRPGGEARDDSAGFASWWRGSSMARSTAPTRVGLGSMRR
ncbi:MAG TPA: hypothetical protein VES20_06450 [Bryobacteraceae bacterium]|nr:hypothetical protein [Bryobacteraceae bacterium]